MKPMSVIVRTVCNVFTWFLMVFGAYVIIHGHLTPGGGFQGGAVVATGVAFLLVAEGGDRLFAWIRPLYLTLLESVGLLVFLGLGFWGIRKSFFQNVLANSGSLFFGLPTPLGSNPGTLATSGTIALMNLAVGLEVMAGLSMILVVMFKGIRLYETQNKGEAGHDR